MGKVVGKIKLTNLFDSGAQHRKLSKAKPRSVEVEALVEEPVDGPMRLQTIRELQAEPVQSRMRRTYYQVIDFRHVPPGSGDFRDLLHGRYTAPFHYSLPPSCWGIKNETRQRRSSKKDLL
ncbi:MAG: hypothetical protein HY298_04615 [Verrucomicrobia bacterium]|nr:hypothetical protein [Verrucomicrobiota bacterium]